LILTWGEAYASPQEIIEESCKKIDRGVFLSPLSIYLPQWIAVNLEKKDE
jgi:hypothetical protein